MKRFGLYSRRVLYDGDLREATITITDGVISLVEFGKAHAPGLVVDDLGDSVIMPGLIDSHVHINEPGRTEWEGFDTATHAAAAGGITTLIDMPLNSTPVTTSRAALDQKRAAGLKALHVNCGFYGGVVPGNSANIPELIEGGVFGLKAFLIDSGIPDFPPSSRRDLEEALSHLRKKKIPLLVHCEVPSEQPDLMQFNEEPRKYTNYLQSRPRKMEDQAIKLMIELCQKFNSPVHFVHLSSSDSIEPLSNAIKSGVPITVETCPHYLFFDAEEIADGNTLLKCAPPIRERENNSALWNAVKKRIISFVVTDHSPCPPGMKELGSGNFLKAWGGVAGLQFSLPATWSKASERGFRIQDISELMSSNVANFLGLGQTKGRIQKGYDADLLVWNPEKEFTATKESIVHRHKISPYEGHRLKGTVMRTYVGGVCVFKDGNFESLNQGKLLERKP